MEITTQPTLARTNPVSLFSEQEVGANLETAGRRNYDVTTDGQRFIVATIEQTADSVDAPLRPIIIVENWFEELKEWVPVP